MGEAKIESTESKDMSGRFLGPIYAKCPDIRVHPVPKANPHHSDSFFRHHVSTPLLMTKLLQTAWGARQIGTGRVN